MSKISLVRFGKSLKHAGHGLYQAMTAENNFRIHLVCAAVVLFICWVVAIPAVETAVIILLIGMVLILELVNTIIERFADLLEPRIHPYVHMIKDMMAGAVLLAAITAIIIGGIIILPPLVGWIKSF